MQHALTTSTTSSLCAANHQPHPVFPPLHISPLFFLCNTFHSITHPPACTHTENMAQYTKDLSIDSTFFEGDSFSGRSHSSSSLRPSAGHHSNHQCFPPPLTELPSPHSYLGFGSTPSYPETPQYYLTSTDPHTSSSSPTFPLRLPEDWSLARTHSLQNPRDSHWGPSHNTLTGLPELLHITANRIPSPTPRASIAPWINDRHILP